MNRHQTYLESLYAGSVILGSLGAMTGLMSSFAVVAGWPEASALEVGLTLASGSLAGAISSLAFIFVLCRF